MFAWVNEEFLSDIFIKGVEISSNFPLCNKESEIKLSAYTLWRISERRCVKFHLYKNEFASGYTQGIAHVEPFVNSASDFGESSVEVTMNYTHQTMVMDMMGPEIYNDCQSR